MLLELQRIEVPPGQHLILQNVAWREFETILEELDDHRSSLIAYENGILEILMPSPEHEFNKEILGDLIKALLEELDMEFCSLGSTTFKKSFSTGIEPDQCFYIQNEAAIRGKKRIDLSIDPPPDLAIEIDVTSRTHPSIYETLGVPELWRFERGNLQINLLRLGKYEEVQQSLIFPISNLNQVIPCFLQEIGMRGRNNTLRAFRQWVRAQLAG